MKKIKTTQKQRNILYVDSDKSLTHDIQDYLERNKVKEKFGLNFVFAKNCKETLKKIAEQQIDLIVMEIVLPIINGYYCLNVIKKEKNRIPVIIYTQLRGPQDLAKMASSGVDNIFIKQLMKIEDMIQMVIGYEDRKVDMDKVLLDLQSQIKSLSDSETQSSLKVTQCPRCGIILPPDSHFCNNCGQKIFKTSKKVGLKEPSKETKPA